ncbi:P27 family phage terminase small subunit [Lacticaseibacillus rhamnosus]|nr:P27 family phage terminase small subunit [Lacticaseibacillus rhamnosus]
MAKDGTNRGGARVGAGRKPKSLHDKLADGREANVIDLPEPANLEGHVMPPVKKYLKAEQKSGLEFDAADIFKETWQWLVERGCERLVNSQLIEQYAVSVSRWIQCEECISKFGFLARHPTTGNAIASPYVAMSRDYMKQSSQLWFQIFQVVKENNAAAYQVTTPQDDVMERLLRTRKGKY